MRLYAITDKESGLMAMQSTNPDRPMLRASFKAAERYRKDLLKYILNLEERIEALEKEVRT